MSSALYHAQMSEFHDDMEWTVSIHCNFLLDYRDRVMSRLGDRVAAHVCSILRSGAVEAVR